MSQTRASTTSTGGPRTIGDSCNPESSAALVSDYSGKYPRTGENARA